MQCWVVEGYTWGFFFWVDFVATVTIIPDIGWISNLFEDSLEDSDGGSATEFTGLIKASKAAKIIKVIRVIRVIRIVRLYRQMQLEEAKVKQNQKNYEKDFKEKLRAQYRMDVKTRRARHFEKMDQATKSGKL